jgi:hypothetical protein
MYKALEQSIKIHGVWLMLLYNYVTFFFQNVNNINVISWLLIHLALREMRQEI